MDKKLSFSSLRKKKKANKDNNESKPVKNKVSNDESAENTTKQSIFVNREAKVSQRQPSDKPINTSKIEDTASELKNIDNNSIDKAIINFDEPDNSNSEIATQQNKAEPKPIASTPESQLFDNESDSDTEADSIDNLFEKKHSKNKESMNNDKLNPENKVPTQSNADINSNSMEQFRYENDIEPNKSVFEDEINLMDYVEIAYRHKIIIILFTIAAILAAYTYSIYQIPYYKSYTKIFIKEELMELRVVNQKPVFKDQLKLSTWIEIIKSTDVASRVSRLMDDQISPGQAKGSISCSTERDEEHIITITATDINPQMATSIANTYYRAISDYDLSLRTDSYARTISYLEKQIDRKNDDLDSLTFQIKSLYRNNKSGNFNSDIEDNFKRLNKFKDMLTTAEVELESETANKTVLEQKLKEEGSSYITETTYSEPLKMRLLNLEVDLARALTKYGENHPKVLGIKTNISNINTLIEEGAEKNIQLKSIGQNPLKQQLLQDLIKSETTVISLKQKRLALKKIIKEMELTPKDTSQLKKLQRQIDALNKTIINLQTQLNEMRLNESVETNRILQLEEARVSNTPTNSKMKLNLLIGAILGMGLGFGLAFLLNTMDNKIKNVRDLANQFPETPIIGTIPLLDFSPLDLDVLSYKETEEESLHKEHLHTMFNEIALNFKYLILNNERNIIGIISSIKGEGKSTITNFLAIALARNNTKVLLIDADFYNPQISKYYHLREKVGFSEVLSEQASLTDAIVKTRLDNLYVLPTGKKPPSVSHLYHSDNFNKYIHEIKSFAGLVIIDTPATMYFPETSILINHLDCTLIAVKIGVTLSRNIKRLQKKLEMLDSCSSGFIANAVKNDIFDSTYKDYYSYGYDYYYYYKDGDDENHKERRKSRNSGYKHKKKHPALKKVKTMFKSLLSINSFSLDDDDDETVGNYRNKRSGTKAKNKKQTALKGFAKVKSLMKISHFDIDDEEKTTNNYITKKEKRKPKVDKQHLKRGLTKIKTLVQPIDIDLDDDKEVKKTTSERPTRRNQNKKAKKKSITSLFKHADLDDYDETLDTPSRGNQKYGRLSKPTKGVKVVKGIKKLLGLDQDIDLDD